jgi:hypothetical protein
MRRTIGRRVRALLSILSGRALDAEPTLFDRVRAEIERNRILIAQQRLAEIRRLPPATSLSEVEWRVFSQFGEDGIIQYLLSLVPIAHDTFLEFGVEDYSEANTRFLLQNNNWRGVIIECDRARVRRIRQTALVWRHDLTVVEAFVTCANVNRLLLDAGLRGDIGLMSIDVDGNDFWIWEAIDAVSPRIVIVEYNSVFGRDAAISVPYEATFSRTRAHFSNLYLGASLGALCHLAKRKGYVFAGATSADNDAFFVRQDVAGMVRAVSCEEGYVESRFRESRDESGGLTCLRGRQRCAAIGHLTVVDVVSGRRGPVSSFCPEAAGDPLGHDLLPSSGA